VFLQRFHIRAFLRANPDTNSYSPASTALRNAISCPEVKNLHTFAENSIRSRLNVAESEELAIWAEGSLSEKV
jgi:hypothetical protein